MTLRQTNCEVQNYDQADQNNRRSLRQSKNKNWEATAGRCVAAAVWSDADNILSLKPRCEVFLPSRTRKMKNSV